MTGFHSEGPSEERRVDIPSDRPPEEVLAAAREAYTPPPVHELAVLVYDSLVDSDDQPDSHQLRFEHDRVCVELEVSALPQGTEIGGHLDSPGAKVALHIRGTGLAMVSEVEDGLFGFRPVPHGLVRLSIESRDPAEVIWTDWFRV